MKHWPKFIVAAVICSAVTISNAGEAQKRPNGPIAPNTKPGAILCEYFRGIPGDNIDALLRNAQFPNSPTESIALNLFEIPADTDDAYGTAVRGFVYPPVSGNYTFWIASDDSSELWLSPSENPADKVKISQVNGACAPRAWDNSPPQKSKPITLYQGRRYYIEALHKEGGGGDNLAVGWQLPDGKMERPIPGSRLAPALVPKPPPPVSVAIQGTLPSKQGFFKCMAKVTNAGAPFDFPFLLYVPNTFGKEPVPSLLFLHGVGEAGTDLEGVYGNGPHGHVRNDKNLREKMPFLIIGPQITGGKSWSQKQVTRATVALLDEILKTYGQYVDKDRVCMTGLSMGGQGAWNVALEAPDRFSAIVPSDPRAVMPEYATERLKDLPVWIIAGAEDGDFTRGAKEMYEALKNNQPKPQLVLVPNCGHGAWGYYYPKWQFYEWMLKWRRSPARVAQAAAVAAAEKKALQDAAKPPPKELPKEPTKVTEVKPVMPPPAKPEVAKPTPPVAPTPPAPPPAKPPAPEVKPPVEVAAKKPEEKPVEVKKPAEPQQAESISDVLQRIAAGKQAETQKQSPPTPIAAANPSVPAAKPIPVVAAVSPQIVPPVAPKKIEAAVLKIEPKPEPPPAESVAAKTEEPNDEAASTVYSPAKHFPYAPVALLAALLCMGTAMYFLSTNDD